MQEERPKIFFCFNHLYGGVSVCLMDSMRKVLEEKIYSKHLEKDIHEVIYEVSKKRKNFWSDIDFFLVPKGPGSFIGIRKLLSMGRVLQFLGNKIVFGIDFLDVLAFPSEKSSFPLLAVLSFKKVFYVRVFLNIGVFTDFCFYEDFLVRNLTQINSKIPLKKIIMNTRIPEVYRICISAEKQEKSLSAEKIIRAFLFIKNIYKFDFSLNPNYTFPG